MIVDGIEVKTILGFPNYAITKDGHIWSNPRKRNYRLPLTSLFGKNIKPLISRFYRGRWLSPTISDWGYLWLYLYRPGIRKGVRCWIHRLVLETYVGPRPKGMECRHLDNNPANNQLENLCWGTKKENQHDRIKNGTSMEGVKHPLVKLTERQVRQIIYTYKTGLFTLMEIASWYQLDWTSIRNIKNKKSWKHLWVTT